ncbi:MAG: hypothetical protein ACAI25_19700 [Planctomycetota bacterium]
MQNKSAHVLFVAKYGVFGVSVVAGVLIGLAACGGGSHHGGSVIAQPNQAGTQIDRMGRPAIATTLVTGARKSEFNHVTSPASQDPSFRQDAIAILTAPPYSNGANAAGLANIIFPDILTIDVAMVTTYLNGRAPKDDVIDASLGLLTNGAVTTDNVGPKVYLSTFPYMGPPIQPQ